MSVAVILQYSANDRKEDAAFLEAPRLFAKSAGLRAVRYQDLRASIERRSVGRRWPQGLLDGVLAAMAATWRLLSLPPRSFPSASVATSDLGLAEEARLFAGVVASFRRPLKGRRLVVFDAHSHGVRREAPAALRRALGEVGMDRVGVVGLAGLIGPDDFFQIDEHFNARGHAKLAGPLLEEITRSSLLESRPSLPRE